MRKKRSAIILYSSSNRKKGMSNSKLINYKNNRYLEMMKALVDGYDEIITVDIKDVYFYETNDRKNEEKIIGYIYRALKKARNDKSLVISLNMPLITRELVNYMRNIDFEEDILIPYADDKLQKFCAIYSKEILSKIDYIIKCKEVSFDCLFNNVSIRYIFPKDKSLFIDIDKLEKNITYYV